MISIALLVPVCSRNQNYTAFEDTPFVKHFYPSFLKTLSSDYRYCIYIGIDSTDVFYIKYEREFYQYTRENIDIKTAILVGCEHKPAQAWNKLFHHAYHAHYDYFYQIGDDIEMLDPWVERFVKILSERENKGVVGGCHDFNYYGRVGRGKSPVIENAFVHRMHYQLFQTFFNKEIENWYCDDWITEVYKPEYSTLCVDVKVQNKVMDRYQIRDIGEKVSALIDRDRSRILEEG